MAPTKILVANRGEIACRILRTLQALGLPSVAVYSRADAGAPHVGMADEAVCIGPPAAARSYLSTERLLDAARHTGADAIHPGYGFLSESAAFARACAEAGVTFIGPPPDAIELMGNKRAAKVAMRQAGVPCVPGFEGAGDGAALWVAHAEQLGYPVLVKAPAGGGGRGMRVVSRTADLPAALRGARAEAESAFGDGELLLEKVVVGARHVEIQVVADTHGAVVHLGERDCSVQRRHQKVIEECPSPAVDADLREQMGRAATAAARACGYVGAGTVELLLGADGSFYFLEMNTRLQVEHPVTELVYGVDLVAWQIAIAAGEPLPRTQEQLTASGHALEARLYAEDPARGFLPQTGPVLRWSVPSGPGIRVDAGIEQGGYVGAHYDPMLAKVVAHGPTREAARQRLVRALEQTTLFGVQTNRDFLLAVCRDEVFTRGLATTAFVGERFAHDADRAQPAPDGAAWALAALAVMTDASQGLLGDIADLGWRSGGPAWSTVVLRSGQRGLEVRLLRTGRGEVGPCFEVSFADPDPKAEAPEEPPPLVLELCEAAPDSLVWSRDGVRRRVRHLVVGDDIWLADRGQIRCFTNVTHAPARAADAAGSGDLRAPLDGAVTQVFTREGDTVTAGTLLLVIEAMKMEHPVVADIDGVVVALRAATGDQVKARQPLVTLEHIDAAQARGAKI